MMKSGRCLFPVLLAALVSSNGWATAPSAPVVDRVVPSSPDLATTTPGVFFFDNQESGRPLGDFYADISEAGGLFRVTEADAFSGGKALENAYLSLSNYTREGKDPGNSGWAWRFFGDSPLYRDRIPESERGFRETAVIRWYHKFQEGFRSRDGKEYPPKMARLHCYPPQGWVGKFAEYELMVWIEGPRGQISINRCTESPKRHREWLPNYGAQFFFADPVNEGRWIHFEARIQVGTKPRDDRWQVWADGLMIAEVVWRGDAPGKSKRLRVDSKSGVFVGSRAGSSALAPNRLHLCRIRHTDCAGNASEWSKWHAAFATDWENGTPPDKRVPPRGYYLGQAAVDWTAGKP